uniref:Uncharacterized protein n=1 Tax=Salix viminalis TaxID=40686 RepID=A0A6N2KVF6_SALVM
MWLLQCSLFPMSRLCMILRDVMPNSCEVGHFLRQNEHPLTKFLTMENSEVLCRNRFGNAKRPMVLYHQGGQIYNERDSKNKRGKDPQLLLNV